MAGLDLHDMPSPKLREMAQERRNSLAKLLDDAKRGVDLWDNAQTIQSLGMELADIEDEISDRPGFKVDHGSAPDAV